MSQPEASPEQQRGLFLVIEGSDGSGKSTQYKLLLERFKAAGHDVKDIKFPRYEEDASYFVRKYLKGEYGGADELGPYTPSLFYALDRYDGGKQIQQWLDEGAIVLADRYIGANKAHQGNKIDTPEARQAYYTWLDQLEFQMLGIPRPNLNIVLTVPPETAQALIRKRGDNQAVDIHDGDPEHLKRATATYQELCQLYPNEYAHIDCTFEGELMSIPAINNLIWERIQPMLKNVFKKKPKQDDSLQSDHPLAPRNESSDYITKNKNGSQSMTKVGEAALADIVTNTDKNVYAFTDQLSSTTIAAAMARLSRRADDMRITLLEEFIDVSGKDDALLRRVITAYGDDSVQQLTGLHFVVENASNILTKKLQWGRLAAYLEQSTRYIYFDKKNPDGTYKYHTPSVLDSATKQQYVEQMDELFTRYAKLVADLTQHVRANSDEPEAQRDGAWKAATRAQACDAARLVLPAATTATVGIYASGQALESLIMHLQSDELAEARAVGDDILTEARKVVPTFLERADKPDRGGAWIAHRAQTNQQLAAIAAEQELQPMKGADDVAVRLTDYWPKNELDTLPHMLYPQSTLSLDQLSETLSQLPYTEKQSIYTQYFGERLNRRHKPGRALETIHYTFDILCDYGIFRDLQRHRMVDALEWQQLTPHYGFQTPQLIIDAQLEDLFESCFSLSNDLYHTLRASGFHNESQYATLLGHTMRWKVTMNAREAFHFMELRTSPQGHPGYRKLAGEMYQSIAAVHPLTASGMIFVNQGEDPELSRLAAERATQFKLDQLGV